MSDSAAGPAVEGAGASSRFSWPDVAGPLALVVLVHLTLALTTFLPVVHTGGDNAAYLTLGSSIAQDGTYRELWQPGAPPHTKYPPGFPTVLALLMVLGFKSFTGFKIVPLAFTTLSTAFCFLWVRRLHSVRFSVGLSLLFGASAAVLFASRWILSDPMFLALTFGSLWLLTPGEEEGVSGEVAAQPLSAEAHLPAQRMWSSRRLYSSRRLMAGMALALLAYFTRSAGIPLVVAVAAWLATRRRFKSLAVFGLAFAVPALLWWLRDARTGHDYVSEFWMINPYAPDLGQMGFGGLVSRMFGNLWLYTADFIPAGLTGLSGRGAALVGIPLAALALYGWVRRVRAGAGVTEWFALLYSGLILVWPEVWSGDRFALPLFPLALLYAGESVAVLAYTFFPGKERWALGGTVLLLGSFMGVSWFGDVGPSMQCRAVSKTGGPWACYAQNVQDFGAMALWAGENLDEEDRVFTRKPRLFYLLSGRQSLVYPFSADGVSLLNQADSVGIEYVVRGNWDRATSAYVDPVLRAHPERFCRTATLRRGNGPPTYLLRVSPPPEPGEGEPGAVAPDNTELVIRDCPHPRGGELPSASVLASNVVPILNR